MIDIRSHIASGIQEWTQGALTRQPVPSNTWTWVERGSTVLALICFLGGCSSSNSLENFDSVSPSQSLAVAPTSASVAPLRNVKTLPPPPNTNGGLDQPISVGDVLSVDVFEVDQLDRVTRVDARGIISLPLIGNVKARGKTTRQLEQELIKRYGKNQLRSPQISIFVKESLAQRAVVDGEVKKSGFVKVSNGATLKRMIAQVGGFTELADPQKVYVFRRAGSERQYVRFNVAAIRSGLRPDPRIYGGDFIMVFSSDFRVATKNLKEALGLASSAARTAVLPIP